MRATRQSVGLCGVPLRLPPSLSVVAALRRVGGDAAAPSAAFELVTRRRRRAARRHCRRMRAVVGVAMTTDVALRDDVPRTGAWRA